MYVKKIIVVIAALALYVAACYAGSFYLPLYKNENIDIESQNDSLVVTATISNSGAVAGAVQCCVGSSSRNIRL
jgi:hypothetical protein